MILRIDVSNKKTGDRYHAELEEREAVEWVKAQRDSKAWGEPEDLVVLVEKLYKGLSFGEKMKLFFSSDRVVVYEKDIKLLGGSGG